MGERLKSIFGTLSCAFGTTSWSVASYEDRFITQTEELKKKNGSVKKPESYELQPGDLVTVFKTVTDGDVHWSGTVKREWERNYKRFPRNPEYGQQLVLGYWVHGLQEDMEPEAWGAMFFDELPAKLGKKSGEVIFGALDAFWETGSEGVHWSLVAYEKNGYSALCNVDDGDRLTVYSSVRDGEIAFQGSLQDILDKADENAVHRLACHHHAVKVEPKP